MASKAHCLYCFESLYASFKGTEPPSLATIETLWEEHEVSKALALKSVADELARGKEEEEEEWEGFPDGPGERTTASAVNEDEGEREQPPKHPDTLKLPSVSRLQGLPSSTSSDASTPSALSTSSSRSALTTTTAVTTPSTRSSSYSSKPNGKKKQYPLFVTWNTLSSSGNKHLRGCIGTFEPQSLSFGLKTYSLSSAFDDTRFQPIPFSLLPSLSCSLTLLSSFQPCSDAMDWVLGTHGIRISFIHRRRRYGATYLPDVAVEQGWSKEETVESLMRKAGWDGPSVYGSVSRRFLRSSTTDSGSAAGKPWEEVSNFEAVKYQGFKSSASYAEWQEWRKWVESLPDHQSLLKPGV